MLTEAQKSSIRMYLGWSDRFHQTDSRLERAFNAIDQLIADGNPATYNLIVAELARMTTVDSAMDAAQTRFKAAKVGSIDLQGKVELGLLRSQGRAAAGRIASLLGVEVRHDVFSGSGPKHHMTYNGLEPAQGTGGGGYPPMG